LALAAAVFACAQSLAAQQAVDYASISGRVSDQSAAVIRGAEVVAVNTETKIAAVAITDNQGRFRFPHVKVGLYEITVRATGFAPVVRGLTVSAGAAFELPVTLSVGPVDAAVTVSADAAVLEAARSQIVATISAAEVTSVPLNGRNFLELALFAPAVSPTNVASTQLFPETSAVGGITLSVASQRNLSNNFVVDGLSANDDAAALSGMTYGVEAIEQFQVVTSGAQAELGRALGGYVNVVTRSGTNTLQGSGYLYIRDDNLNARNRLSGSKLPMNQKQYGASAGGPVVPNRTFYFANAEQKKLDQTGLTTITPGQLLAINTRLAATGYPGPQVTTGVYPNPIDTTNLLAKIDHHFTGRQQTSFRYGLYDVGARNARGAGGLAAPTASSGLENLDQTISASNAWTLSERTLLETRAQFVHGDLEALPSEPIGPAVSILGVASFGTLSTSPTGRLNRMSQVVNNLSHQRGAHAFRAGVDLLHNLDRITFPRAARGSYAFTSLPNFLAGIYGNGGFTQTFAASEVEQGNWNLGLYLQDEWKVGSGVTLNLGARYDLQFLETIRTDTNNLAPRIGAVWSPFASQRTLIRASAGVFYDRVPLRALANALLSAGNTADVSRLRQIAVSLTPGQAGAPAFPNILNAVVPTVTLPNLTTMDRDLGNASSRQLSVEVEHQVTGRTTVSAGYQYLRGVDLLMAINQNVPSCVAQGNNNGCRPNPDYANNTQYSAAGASNYHGLHLSLMRRPAGWGHYRVSYTLSKSMNNVGEFFFSSPIDPFDLSKDWARSDDDQRHRLVLHGALYSPMAAASTVWERLVHGFEASALLQVYSATPFNITSGVTTVQGTPGRPIVGGSFIPRNAGSSTAFISLGARVMRSFDMTNAVTADVILEGFNLTNRLNVLTRNTNFGSGSYPSNPLPTFGQVTGVAEPRAIQLGVRVRF
jgi:hypothetical protein